MESRECEMEKRYLYAYNVYGKRLSIHRWGSTLYMHMGRATNREFHLFVDETDTVYH
jgi:hypothetical protein